MTSAHLFPVWLVSKYKVVYVTSEACWDAKTGWTNVSYICHAQLLSLGHLECYKFKVFEYEDECVFNQEDQKTYRTLGFNVLWKHFLNSFLTWAFTESHHSNDGFKTHFQWCRTSWRSSQRDPIPGNYRCRQTVVQTQHTGLYQRWKLPLKWTQTWATGRRQTLGGKKDNHDTDLKAGAAGQWGHRGYWSEWINSNIL